MRNKNIKNMQFKNQIFKICNYVNFLVRVWSVSFQSNLERNFVPLDLLRVIGFNTQNYVDKAWDMQYLIQV